jgi:DnaJ-class molecular chaperone
MKKGDVKCKKCNGKGEVDKPFTFMNGGKHIEAHIPHVCSKCLGDGHLDWVENITGKKMSDLEKKNEELKKALAAGNWKITSGKK